MRRMMLLLAALSVAPVALVAQADSVALVITLGQDTIGVERYTRAADRLVDDMVMRERAPAIARHLVATMGPDGLIATLEIDNKALGEPEAPPVHIAARYTKEDAFIDVTRNGQTTTSHVVTPDGALPFINFCYALYDQVGMRARAVRGSASSTKVSVLNFGAATPFDLTVTLPAPDSMTVAFPDDTPTLFRVSRAGRIQAVDGRLTTQKVL